MTINETKSRLLNILTDKNSTDKVIVDVLPIDLESLKNNILLGSMIVAMVERWTMGDKKREERVRIGSIEVYRNKYKNLCMDFTARF